MVEKKKTRRNDVHLVGYIKEDNLEIVTQKHGEQVIRGNLVVVTDEKGSDSQKVQFWVSENTRKGDHSKDYDNLSELLPGRVVSVASFLEENPDANFEEAAKASTKVWIIARLDEYARRNGERVDSSVMIKGFRAGLKKDTDKIPFAPKAEFDIDVYLEDITPEVGENETETGRLCINGIFLDYKGKAQKFDFVAPTEGGIAAYIKGHYAVGTTVNLKGDLVNIIEREIDEDAEDEYFGRGNGPQYKTTFVRERRIRGGSKTPLKDGEDGAYTKKAIADGLAAREVTMDENGKKYAARINGEGAFAKEEAPTPTPVKGFGTDSSDLDF